MVRIKDIAQHEGKDVQLQGWMFNRRGSKRFVFMQLRDGSGFIQGVLNRDEVDEVLFDQIKRLPLESSVTVTGTVAADTRSKLGYELHVKDVRSFKAHKSTPSARRSIFPTF